MNIGINDKLDALITLTAKDCGNGDVEMFNNLDTSKVTLDQHFYMKLKRIINRHKHSAAIITVKKCLVRAAVALMALMSLGFLTIMATPDLREAIFEAVVEWYENYISIRYEPVKDDTDETDITEESTDVSLTETSADESKVPAVVVPPTKIEKVMKPAYIPKDLEEEVVKSNISGLVIDYYFGNDLYFTYHQTIINDHNVLFDNDSATITETQVNNDPAQLIEFSDREDKVIVWTDGVYMYYIELFGPSISINELVRIASSVK